MTFIYGLYTSVSTLIVLVVLPSTTTPRNSPIALCTYIPQALQNVGRNVPEAPQCVTTRPNRSTTAPSGHTHRLRKMVILWEISEAGILRDPRLICYFKYWNTPYFTYSLGLYGVLPPIPSHNTQYGVPSQGFLCGGAIELPVLPRFI